MSTCPHCGCEIVKAGKPRSVEQLRRYFAMVRLAFENWPENNERQFASVEECRKYLQMKAGHREIGASIPLTGISKERAVILAEASVRAAGAYAVPVIHGDALVVFRPKSIAFGKLSHHDFCKLNDDVANVIEAETGIKVDDLMKEASAA